MGYTHYWNHTGFTDEQWTAFTILARTVIHKYEGYSGGSLAWESDLPNHPPEVSAECVRFNGLAEEGYETFCLTREPCQSVFCKTNNKPYDAVVVAVLLAAKASNPEFDWSSDGDAESGDFDAANVLLQGGL